MAPPAVTAADAAPWGAALPDGAPAEAAADPDGTVVVQALLGEYVIELSRPSVPPGPVRFDVTNAGNSRHNLHLTGDGVDVRSANLLRGESGTFLATFASIGEYTLFCDLGFHAAAGMTVTFVVE